MKNFNELSEREILALARHPQLWLVGARGSFGTTTSAMLFQSGSFRRTIGHQEVMLKITALKHHFFRDRSRNITSNIRCRSELPESQRRKNNRTK
jgi:hypothetical protein